MSDTTKQDNISNLFSQLVLSFHAAAWQQMGKSANPFTGEVERNLDMAKNSIDILGMLEEKTKGNLTEQEVKILQHILTELRMNYVDEAKKPDPEKKEDKTPKDDTAEPEQNSDKGNTEES